MYQHSRKRRPDYPGKHLSTTMHGPIRSFGDKLGSHSNARWFPMTAGSQGLKDIQPRPYAMTATTHLPAWLLIFVCTPCAAQSGTALDEIEVVASSPLGDSRVDDLASNYQAIDGEDLRRQQSLDVTELINRSLGSVFINEAQSNPLQPDVQYRGFVGSPLLGLPQGIAVYQNGVRINEPFGDTVNWALIPGSAIDELYLLPGSDPVFGLNALGGSISIRTRDGFAHPGARASFVLGSFARLGAQAETGGSFNESLAYFATASYLAEDGWRDFSATRAVQTFGSLKWQIDGSSVDTRLTYVDTSLTGNGAAPVQLLAIDRSAIFTHPDNTQNELLMLDVGMQHELSDAVSMSANVYLRGSDIATLNGDNSDFDACATNPAVMCDGDELLLDADGIPIPAVDSVLGATINRTVTEQDGSGASIQIDVLSTPGGMDNLMLAGISYDGSDIEFSSDTELGSLSSSRGAIPGGAFVASSQTRLSTDSSNKSLYFSDVLALNEKLRVGVAGRYNYTETQLRDRISTALNGTHNFHRFNPSAKLIYQAPAVQVYLRYSESTRVPSPVELTCADKDAPCRLPNAFLSDPPLAMVVAKTWESGLRHRGERLQWHAGVFQTTTFDDIIFISAGAFTNQGFFDNVGKTRRLGVELNVNGRIGTSLEWFLNYTRLEATFEDAFTISSPNNPASENGEIRINAGDRLPLIPGHLFKGGLTWFATDRLQLGADLQANSDSYLRGDEGNDVRPLDGYSVLNAYGSFAVNDRLKFSIRIANVLDADYESFGLFGEADEVLGDEFDDTRFVSPGAPRAAWLGITLAL